jgi:uncharacterized protein (TIGR02001 family)
MRNLVIGLLATALVAAPSFAQDAPASEFTITGSAAATTDYRFRGISQSNEKIAVQAGGTITHSSGFYVSGWGSSIDDYVAAGADAELDLIAGYSTTINGFTLDGGVLYYVYPSAVKGYNSDFFEPYASIKYTYGPVTAKVGAAYAPKQKAIGSVFNAKEDNLYVYTDLSTGIPETPITLTGHVGYSRGRSLLTFSAKDYIDWSVGAAYTYDKLTFGVSYVDTDVKKDDPYFAGFYDQVDATILGTISVAF